MRRLLPAALVLLIGGIGASVLSARVSNQRDVPTIVMTPEIAGHFVAKESEAAGLCPWRNRTADLKRFFPDSSGVEETTLVVSSQRIAITKRLGRTPTGDENGLRVYRVTAAANCCGDVITRRVRGEYGLIELVLVVGADQNAIKDAYIQRLREPEPAATALQSTAWLSQFRGLNGDSDWRVIAKSHLLPVSAGKSAAAITDAARTAMVLLSTAQLIHTAIPH